MKPIAAWQRVLLLVAMTLATGGCVQDRLYIWNDYEDGLYNYYKDPEQLAALMETLRTAIAENEQAVANGGASGSGKPAIRRVPPGLYAEYGYLLLLANRQQEAKEYFQKEKATWPESATLMDRMIAATSNPSKTPSGPAGEKSAGR